MTYVPFYGLCGKMSPGRGLVTEIDLDCVGIANYLSYLDELEISDYD